MSMGCFLTKMLTWMILCQWEPVTTNPIHVRFLPTSLTIHDTEEGKALQEAGDSHLFFFLQEWSPFTEKSSLQVASSSESSYLNSIGQFFSWTYLADLPKPLSVTTSWLLCPLLNIQLFEVVILSLHLYSSEQSVSWWQCEAHRHNTNKCIIGNAAMAAIIKADKKTKAH